MAELETALVQRDRVIAEQGERIAELERRLGRDSTNSSRPPSSDALWDKKAAKRRSSRSRSGRKPGKQPGASSSSRSLIDDPDEIVVLEPECCRGCASPLAEASVASRERRQVVDVGSVPPPEVTEYQRVSKVCVCCGEVTTPGWDQVRADDPRRDVVAGLGSPVRIG
ncbi:MAG: DUF6444 domain-containing protein, partial [Actinophytocola sp.]|uniref:DUF6444 domain-containing protein n=1 Tax=Actinophytocola sp. TaxID=1872138 RepID=UPI003C7473A6